MATVPAPSAVLDASSTRSNATALISTPAPNAMIRPRIRLGIGTTSAITAPTSREDAPTAPQKKASPIGRQS